MNITGNEQVSDWRTTLAPYQNVCPACLSALKEESNVVSAAGHMVMYQCVNDNCRRREMRFERSQDKARRY